MSLRDPDKFEAKQSRCLFAPVTKIASSPSAEKLLAMTGPESAQRLPDNKQRAEDEEPYQVYEVPVQRAGLYGQEIAF